LRPTLYLLASLAVLGCKERTPAHDNHTGSGSSTIATGSAGSNTPADALTPQRWYRVDVVVKDYETVPFFLGVRSGDPIAIIDNGEDRVEVQAEVTDSQIYARFPVFGTELRLGKQSGQWAGEWNAEYRLKQNFVLQADEVPAPSPRARFADQGPPAASIAGQWRVDIKGFGIGRAVFRQDESGVLTGSLVPPEVGDTRYMSGRVSGNTFAMSTFDGIHAYLVDGTIVENGARLEGRWIWPGVNTWTFVATRGEQPKVADLVSAKLRKGATHITLPELAGYKGKPVLVDFFGTWCPACLDLTPQLVRLYNTYKDQGLVLLSIAIEPPGDAEATERRLAEYRKKYGVTWDIAVRYVDDYTTVIPPEIENALGFPVTIFVRRDQSIAGVHTAFVSDAARPEHTAVLERFEEWAKEIVASPAPKTGSQK
jgi:thiol-disulfide isomerase/thioredoxin